MAVTSIWEIHSSLAGVINYAENPEKTGYEGLRETLHYAEDGSKTQAGEKVYLVTGIACGDDTAYDDMMTVKERYGKTGGIVAMHGYQSFKPGEVTPEKCHEIGVRLARELWGDRYQVVVATHLNTDCCHNHFVINTVSFANGKKFPARRTEYYRMREASDRLCREYGLSVVERPSGARTPRKIFIDEKEGKPTLYNIIREDIDAACLMSDSQYALRLHLSRMGYELEATKTGLVTIRTQGMKYPVSLRRLGPDYEWAALCHRVYANERATPGAPFFLKRTTMRYRGQFAGMKKITGLRALYFHYLYRMGILPNGGRRKPLSPEMRREVMKMDSYMQQMKLLTAHQIGTVEELVSYREDCTAKMETLIKARSRLDNRRYCKEPEKKEDFSRQRKELTAVISAYRKDIRLTVGIEQNTRRMRVLIRLEEQQMLLRSGKAKERIPGRKHSGKNVI